MRFFTYFFECGHFIRAPYKYHKSFAFKAFCYECGDKILKITLNLVEEQKKENYLFDTCECCE